MHWAVGHSLLRWDPLLRASVSWKVLRVRDAMWELPCLGPGLHLKRSCPALRSVLILHSRQVQSHLNIHLSLVAGRDWILERRHLTLLLILLRWPSGRIVPLVLSLHRAVEAYRQGYGSLKEVGTSLSWL